MSERPEISYYRYCTQEVQATPSQLYPTYYLKKVRLLERQRYPNPNESSSVTNCSNYTPIKLLQANCN